jgi:hypothetical protein
MDGGGSLLVVPWSIRGSDFYFGPARSAGAQVLGIASQTGLPATGYTDNWRIEQPEHTEQAEQPSRKAGYPTRSTNP